MEALLWTITLILAVLLTAEYHRNDFRNKRPEEARIQYAHG